MSIVLAQLLDRDREDEAAITELREAAAKTTSRLLRQAIGTLADDIAGRLILAAPDRASSPLALGLAAAQIAAKTSAAQSEALNSYGVTLRRIGCLENSLAVLNRAIELGANDATSHIDRGDTLRLLGRVQEARTAYDQAQALDPNRAEAHENKGILLAQVGDLDGALIELNTSERLEPSAGGEGRTWAGAILWHRHDIPGAPDRFGHVTDRVTGRSPFRIAEIEAIALCGLNRAEDAEKHLMEALTLRLPGDRAESQALYDLLADPPLPGIERLRAIAGRDAYIRVGSEYVRR